MPDGTSRTIKSQYGQTSTQNFESQSSYGASGVLQVIRLGNVSGKNTQSRTVYDKEGICPTLVAGMGEKSNVVPYITEVEKLKVNRLGGLYDQGDNKHQMGSVWDKDGIAPTIDTMTGGLREPMIIEESRVIGGFGEMKSNNGTQYYQQDRVYSMGDISPCIPSQMSNESYNFLEEKKVIAIDEQNLIARYDTIGTLTTDGNSPKHNNRVAECAQIKIRQATDQGFALCEIGGVADLNYTGSQTRRGRVIENGKICPALTTENIPNVIELGNPKFYSFLYKIEDEWWLIRIRKLTPKECWRLMGFADDDFERAEKVNSNTQLYKQAGNSIVVNVLEAIFKQLLGD